MIISFPDTPSFSFPFNSTLSNKLVFIFPSNRKQINLPFVIGGTCHQVSPVAQIAAASVLTTGVPKHPNPIILEQQQKKKERKKLDSYL